MSVSRQRGARWLFLASILVSSCDQQLYQPGPSPAGPWSAASPAGPWTSASPAGSAPAASPVASTYAQTSAPRPAVIPAVATTIERPLMRDESAKSGRGELDLRVDRLWQENGFTYASLSVRNTSQYELEEITIQCTAIGKGHVNMNFREQTLLTRKDGQMLPGFAKTMRIRLERGGFGVREMTCTARGW